MSHTVAYHAVYAKFLADLEAEDERKRDEIARKEDEVDYVLAHPEYFTDPCPARDLKPGGYVTLRGRPCLVEEVSHSK